MTPPRIGGLTGDQYTANRKEIIAMYGSAYQDTPSTQHEHAAACGGYYQHAHRGGTKLHTHEHSPCDRCRP